MRPGHATARYEHAISTWSSKNPKALQEGELGSLPDVIESMKAAKKVEVQKENEFKNAQDNAEAGGSARIEKVVVKSSTLDDDDEGNGADGEAGDEPKKRGGGRGGKASTRRTPKAAAFSSKAKSLKSSASSRRSTTGGRSTAGRATSAKSSVLAIDEAEDIEQDEPREDPLENPTVILEGYQPMREARRVTCACL